ncbi:unnamed protein product [Caenorhabditis angaria]|uniref:Ubiquitin carboxyl-terminal hydrolase n=1 Tax=Caenorhabditis angaria TaxID=860376 RepID=A0A9P1N5Z0_9PELO|nr:unnamed protein product [Caenorhabditis angaria]
MTTWTPLESNPNVINPMIQKIGVSGLKAVDVLFFDDETIEKPQFAVLLCFPEYKKVDEIMKPIYESAKPANDSIFFMKQKIANACGTFALFHALANSEDQINIGDGTFGKWLKEAKNVGVEERSGLLEADKHLSEIHASAAQSGQSTQVDDVNHHFICFVAKNGVLFEIDSRRGFAREVGPTSDETLVKDSGEACKHLIEKLNNVSFSAIALVKN